MGLNWPFIKHDDHVRLYLILQFGHHLQSKKNFKFKKPQNCSRTFSNLEGLISHLFFMVGTPSYHTMNIHHFATVLSIVHSYFTNYEEYGILVLIMSDVSDCFLNFGKQSRDL